MYIYLHYNVIILGFQIVFIFKKVTKVRIIGLYKINAFLCSYYNMRTYIQRVQRTQLCKTGQVRCTLVIYIVRPNKIFVADFQLTSYCRTHSQSSLLSTEFNEYTYLI
jgi:hypothetical protein